MSQFFPGTIQSTYLQNGMSWDISGVQGPIGKGIYQQTHYTYSIVPNTADTNIIAGASDGTQGSQVPYAVRDSSGNIQYYTVNLRNVNNVYYNGTRYVVLDCYRVPTVRFILASPPAATPALTVTIFGLDYNLKETVASLQIAANIPSTTTYYLTKSFRMVSKITFSQALTISVEVGTGNKFGLPHFVPNTNYIENLKWDSENLNVSTFTPGVIWRQTSNTSTDANYNIPTAFSGDAMGVIDLTGQGSLPNDSRVLTAHYYVYGNDGDFMAQVKNANAEELSGTLVNNSPIRLSKLKQNTSGNYVLPYFVDQDVQGAQYPYDNAFMTIYRTYLKG